MKKILFIIFSLIIGYSTFMIDLKDVQASTITIDESSEITKPLVCVKGNDYDNILDYEGYTIISSTVNFNISGEYYVTYQNNINNQILSKKVTIIEKNEVFNNTYYHVDKHNLGYSFNDAILVDSIEISDKEMYLLEYLTFDELFSYILTRVVDNQIVSSKIIKSQMIGAPIAFEQIDNQFVILGHTYNETTGIDIYLGSFDYQGEIIQEISIGGNNIDSALGLLVESSNCYIWGHTKSNNSYFKTSESRLNEDAFLMKLNLNTLYPLCTTVLTYQYYNEIFDVVLSNNKLYALHSFTDVSDGSSLRKSQMLIFNQDLNLEKQKTLENSVGLTPIKLDVMENRVYLLAYQYDYGLGFYASCIYQFNDALTMNLYDRYVNYNEESVVVVDFKITDDQKCLYLYQVLGIEEGTYLIVKQQNEVLFSLKISGNEFKGFKFVDECYAFLTTQKQLVSLNYIKGISEGNTIINETNQNYGDNQVMINNEIITSQSNNLKMVNPNVFGNYFVSYLFKTNQIDFCFYQDIEVECMTSIESNETYDKNVQLSFNGEGYLNNVKIASGYEVSEEGDYVLEVQGKSGNKRIYKFKVVDYSYENCFDVQRIKINNINYQDSLMDNTTILNISNLDSFDEENHNMNYYWLVLVPLVLIVGGTIILKKVSK